MNLPAFRRRALAVLVGMGLPFVHGCSSDPAAPQMRTSKVRVDGLSFARANGGPSVSTTAPDYGRTGETNLEVTVTGSGFVDGSVPAWERGGVADPKVQVVSTRVVSSTQLVATISIAPDATVDLYDVSVTNPDKKKGIGYLLFEVTQATAISGTEIAYGVNDAGEITGRVGVPGVFYYNPATGLDTLGAPGRGFDISGDGRSVVGGTTINAPNDRGYVFTFDGVAWTRTDLPKASTSTMTRPFSVASDPTTGSALLIGGWEGGGSNAKLYRRPRLWVPAVGGGWTKIDLADASNDGVVADVSPSGVAAGFANERAAVWSPDGSGGWTGPSFIGVAGSKLNGINTAATIAVGEVASGGSSTAAASWVNTGGSWSAPTVLPGGCTSAKAIDDSGRIVANGCPKGSRRVPGVIAPPYTSADVTLLGGLGDNASTTIVEDISRNGGIIVGQSTVHNAVVGVYWQLF